MAKFKKSAFTPQLRGKVASSVFSENRYGPYTTLKTQPSRRKTSAQERVRHGLKNVSQIWSYNLREDQYQAWTKFAVKFKSKDSSGNIYNPAPRDIFTAFNRNLQEVGLPVKVDPPKKASVQSFSSFKFEIIAENDNNDIRLFFEPAINDDTRIMIFATFSLRNSIFYFRDNRFKKIGYIDSSFKSGDSILSLYRSLPVFNYKFGGSFKIAFHLKPVSAISGYSKELIETSASVYQNIPR